MTAHDDSLAPGLRLTARAPLMVLGFAAVVLAAWWYAERAGYVLLDPRSNPRKAQTLYAYASRAEREDVLLIGSSRVAGGLDGRILEKRLRAELGDEELGVYKLGLAGLRPWPLYKLLRDGVATRPPKRLLAIAIETRFFLTPRREADDPRPGAGEREDPIDLLAPEAGAGDELRGEWESDSVDARFWDVFRGVESLWQFDWRTRADVEEQRRFQQANNGEGMTVAARDKREAAQSRAREGELDNLASTAWTWSEAGTPDAIGFQRCLELLDELPCEVIFLRMPLEQGFDETYMAAEVRRFDAEILPALAAHDFAYHDLNAEPYPRETRFYMSKTHLNRAGCERTSRLLVTEVLAPALRATVGERRSR